MAHGVSATELRDRFVTANDGCELVTAIDLGNAQWLRTDWPGCVACVVYEMVIEYSTCRFEFVWVR